MTQVYGLNHWFRQNFHSYELWGTLQMATRLRPLTAPPDGGMTRRALREGGLMPHAA